MHRKHYIRRSQLSQSGNRPGRHKEKADEHRQRLRARQEAAKGCGQLQESQLCPVGRRSFQLPGGDGWNQRVEDQEERPGDRDRGLRCWIPGASHGIPRPQGLDMRWFRGPPNFFRDFRICLPFDRLR